MGLKATLWPLAFVLPAFALVNPILPGFNPDPSIIRVKDDYFIATSTFEHFPGHPIWHSKNLVDWKLIGHALNRPSQLSLLGAPPEAGAWAPTLRYHKGVYYLASTIRHVYTPELRLFPRSFYVTSTNPFSNDWSDPIFTDGLGYDPDLFWDTNGDVWNTWCGINNAKAKIYGIWQNKIDVKTGDSLTPATLIYNGTLLATPLVRPEAPHLYLVNGTYYLIIAEGGTEMNHRVTVVRSSSLSGPWENNPKNPIMYNGRDPTLPVQSTGHADLVQAPNGEWWGVALAVRPQAKNMSHIQLGRETFLYPVTWGDGWPVLNGGKPLLEHLPGVLKDKSPLSDYTNDFTSLKLDHTFYTVRTALKSFYSFKSRQGFLRLKGNGYAPGDRDTPAMLLRKQTAHHETFEVRLDGSFQPKSTLSEAGATVFYGDLLHNDIAVTGDPAGSGKRVIVCRTIVQATQIGPWALTTTNSTITTVIYSPPLKTPNQDVTFTLTASPGSYALAYAEGSDKLTVMATFDVIAVSVPPAGSFFFKGNSFGIYNTGNGKPTLDFADFSHLRQIPGVQ